MHKAALEDASERLEKTSKPLERGHLPSTEACGATTRGSATLGRVEGAGATEAPPRLSGRGFASPGSAAAQAAAATPLGHGQISNCDGWQPIGPQVNPHPVGHVMHVFHAQLTSHVRWQVFWQVGAQVAWHVRKQVSRHVRKQVP
jgi:hypothetical protein